MTPGSPPRRLGHPFHRQPHKEISDGFSARDSDRPSAIGPAHHAVGALDVRGEHALRSERSGPGSTFKNFPTRAVPERRPLDDGRLHVSSEAERVSHLAPFVVAMSGSQLLLQSPATQGLVVNPGSNLGFDIEPAGMRSSEPNWRDGSDAVERPRMSGVPRPRHARAATEIGAHDIARRLPVPLRLLQTWWTGTVGSATPSPFVTPKRAFPDTVLQAHPPSTTRS